MKNLLHYGPFGIKAPWANEYPIGEIKSRIPRIAIASAAVLAIYSNTEALERAVHHALLFSCWEFLYKFVTPLMFVISVAVFYILYPEGWRCALRNYLNHFLAPLAKDESKDNPWKGIRYDNTESNALPGVSGEYPNMTVYATAIPQSPAHLFDVVELCLMDDEGEMILHRQSMKSDSCLDVPELKEMLGTGVLLGASSSTVEEQQTDDACARVLYHATEVVSYMPATTILLMDSNGYLFDVRAINVLDECAALGLSVATDRKLTHWKRLQRCAQTLGTEHAPTKIVAYSSRLATLLTKEVHLAAKSRHEALQAELA